ncbi:MAG TPA: hypothetical protein DEF85_00950 [Clostridiaceae bacterium]|jgi:energy-converting hydrogenase Eha subunit C|nr:hypothetical protein [Clostridiaceae bacterium]HBF76992.1 hypothetical protein [Clostridiaceae bacterium]HBG38432.1 hypothetical protein [Clostridiaceae bacterium]HBN28686.1 hypothetical protein [Clostridiaceae bacterium]HBX47456.1 hypothetical protein [Clostridiaceae bacterium]
MEHLDLLSIVLVVIGSILVYGAKPILKKIKKYDDKVMIAMKLIGLIIAGIGFFRILEII